MKFRSALGLTTALALCLAPGAATAADQAESEREETERQAAEDTGKRFGDVVKDRQGEDIDAGLSWRVALLPYLGHTNLHDQFHHDEPWDSEHNRQLVSKMPRIYRSSPTLPEGHTTLLALVSEKSVITRETGGIRMSDITDGASRTILCVVADPEKAVPWTRPKDIRFDPQNPMKGLDDRGYFLALFVDGSVHRIPTTIEKQTMINLVYRNDGEPVSVDFLR